MGCDDYYDPVREHRDKNWDRNNDLLSQCNCKRLGGAGNDHHVGCCECGAMVFTGDLWQQEDLPWVRAHHQWHLLTLPWLPTPGKKKK